MTFQATNPPRILRVDPKLARGLTMAEVRPILRAPPGSATGSLRDASHPARKAFKAVAWRYQTTRLPDAAYVSGLARTVDDLFAQDPGTLARQAEDLPGKPALPWFSRTFLSLAPATAEPDAGSLVATAASFLVDTAQVSLCQARVMEITLHAVERFHQRTRGGMLRDALANIGREALANVGLIQMMLDVDGRRPGATLVLPFGDGLILGVPQTLPARLCAPFALVHYIGSEPETVQDKPLTPVLKTGRRSETGVDGLGFKAVTFIGPSEMHPRQFRLRDALVALRVEHASILRRMTDTLLSPGRTIAEMSEDDVRRFIREGQTAFDAVRDLIESPEHRRAVSWSREAAEVDMARSPAAEESRTASTGSGMAAPGTLRDLMSGGAALPDASAREGFLDQVQVEVRRRAV